ncbi:MATH domain and coiled-coil domain-containing protein At1g31390-like [Corylus avellana]|uniref:MATH domain and coiled-coil domain-containing protein At1g31390-like n=1 Tax=Corylus avellana TaxID=13451 RepID=UPI00286C8C48|nr:MATH domain and coiled-coil domain-containing protein At1g31390-like [Corylus avellana]
MSRKLVLYPNGKVKSHGTAYISLYLEIAATEGLPLGSEVNMNIRFFVFDQIRNKYLSIQDVSGRVRRFHNLKTEWEFDQLLSYDTLNDLSNSYLVDDSCAFRVEVFIIKCTGKGECSSMIKEPQSNYFTWRIDNYTDMKDQIYYSEHFTVEGRRWKLSLYPKGNGTGVGTCLSLYLCLGESETLPPNKKLCAKYKLRVKDQIHGNHHEKTVERWFSDPSIVYGIYEYFPLRDLLDASKGYLVLNGLHIECIIDAVSILF